MADRKKARVLPLGDAAWTTPREDCPRCGAHLLADPDTTRYCSLVGCNYVGPTPHAPAAAPDGEGEPDDWSGDLTGEEYALLCTMHDTSYDWGAWPHAHKHDAETTYQRSWRARKAVADYITALRARITEGDAERESLREGWSRTNASSEATFQRATTAQSRLSTLEGENARLRADAARLDWLEKQVAATPEQGHGGDIMVWGSHRGPTIGHGAWLNPTTTEHNDSGPSLRTAIDAAMSRRADPHGGER